MITSPANDKVKNVIKLNEKAKIRRKDDAFVIEGIKMFMEAPKEAIREVYLSENFKENAPEPVRKKLEQTGFETVTEEVFCKMSDTQTPQGILCVLKMLHYTEEQVLKKSDKNRLFLILEDIQDPGNLGTILRTGEGAGVDGIIMTRDTVDIYNPKTIRSTMGSLYRMPFYYTDNLQETIKKLKQQKIRIYAAHLKGKNLHYDEEFHSDTAFLIGNEGNGLKEETAKAADDYIRIPMEGKVESLNAAVAATLLAYEFYRQNRK